MAYCNLYYQKFTLSAFATDRTTSNKSYTLSTAEKAILKNRDNLVEELDKVAKAPIKETKENLLPNGDFKKVEVRKIKATENLSITNTRTYTTSSSTKTITDEYGLDYAGIPNGGGSIVAVYKYNYVDIDSPNHMKTQIYSASGHANDLDSNFYKLSYVDPNWDTTPEYQASASVVFHMQMNGGIWYNVTITNECEFNSYGEYSTSWS